MCVGGDKQITKKQLNKHNQAKQQQKTTTSNAHTKASNIHEQQASQTYKNKSRTRKQTINNKRGWNKQITTNATTKVTTKSKQTKQTKQLKTTRNTCYSQKRNNTNTHQPHTRTKQQHNKQQRPGGDTHKQK